MQGMCEKHATTRARPTGEGSHFDADAASAAKVVRMNEVVGGNVTGISM